MFAPCLTQNRFYVEKLKSASFAHTLRSNTRYIKNLKKYYIQVGASQTNLFYTNPKYSIRPKMGFTLKI